MNTWLIANKLVINISKTVQLNVKPSASNCDFSLNSCQIKVKSKCNYLCFHLKCKLLFISHKDFVKLKLGKQCGLISKLRHFLLSGLLLDYYSSHVVPILQYGILVYRCRSFSVLNPIFVMQKKILIFFFRKQQDQCEDFFGRNKLLTVYQYHISELLKFLLKFSNKMHCKSLIETFRF